MCTKSPGIQTRAAHPQRSPTSTAQDAGWRSAVSTTAASRSPAWLSRCSAVLNRTAEAQCSVVGAQVYGVEWSYGYMETPGTGVYSCTPKQNPMCAGTAARAVLSMASRSAPAARSRRDGEPAGTPSGRASRSAKRGSAPLRCATSPGAGSWDDLPGTAPDALACRAQVKLLIRRLQVGLALGTSCCAALPGAL